MRKKRSTAERHPHIVQTTHADVSHSLPTAVALCVVSSSALLSVQSYPRYCCCRRILNSTSLSESLSPYLGPLSHSGPLVYI